MKVQNATTIKELRKAGGLSLSEGFPTVLNDRIIPVMEVNPSMLRVSNICRHFNTSTTAAETIYTTPTNRDFFLTSVGLSVTFDVTADNTLSYVQVTTGGSIRVILAINKQTTTAVSGLTNTVTLSHPLLIDRNTAIVLVGSFTVGAGSKVAFITGYEVEAFENL